MRSGMTAPQLCPRTWPRRLPSVTPALGDPVAAAMRRTGMRHSCSMEAAESQIFGGTQAGVTHQMAH